MAKKQQTPGGSRPCFQLMAWDPGMSGVLNHVEPLFDHKTASMVGKECDVWKVSLSWETLNVSRGMFAIGEYLDGSEDRGQRKVHQGSK